ncbi:MAG: ribonuclease P protein component [Desulfomonilaceae bacterium]
MDNLFLIVVEPRAGSDFLSRFTSHSFSRSYRLRKSDEFEVVMGRGSLRQTSHFKIRALRNAYGLSRLGLVVGKRVGNACVRNLVKRRLREYFRLNRLKLLQGVDFVIIAKVGSGSITSGDVNKELDSIFSRSLA